VLSLRSIGEPLKDLKHPTQSAQVTAMFTAVRLFLSWPPWGYLVSVDLP
jgi:hypothetical protein